RNVTGVQTCALPIFSCSLTRLLTYSIRTYVAHHPSPQAHQISLISYSLASVFPHTYRRIGRKHLCGSLRQLASVLSDPSLLGSLRSYVAEGLLRKLLRELSLQLLRQKRRLL